MSASAIVPLTVTYSGSTVTVLGQVLNNGGTNWIPTGTSDKAIYLATTSEASASQTVLEGTTYWLSPGPAVPAQVTLSISGPASASASASSMGAGATSSGAKNGAGPTTSMSISSPSMSASAAASSSSSTGAGMRSVTCASAGRMGLVLGLLCVMGIVAA